MSEPQVMEIDIQRVQMKYYSNYLKPRDRNYIQK